ncbi:response regulator [Metabacillus litoralis]|uniref:Response regulator n=1 Tax=Metabacillus litoralis TaxID=152268 RepID=A0A5C6W120_9BACI|nr:response regulator [Metabacillus litoralis]TXC90602.1 response regulator [Metabacillus litoralis]
MYNVMLVDDDYPVLELLIETINWNQLGLNLQSTHENGANALTHALNEMPDILITDIGMPKMNGLELTKKLKELNPNIQVCMLTCHNEFDYAHQALKLNVQDYLLKDTLNPKDLTEVLKKLKQNKEREDQKKIKEFKLESIVERNRESMKRDFLRKTIDQSSFENKGIYDEARSYGLDLTNRMFIPVLCFIQDYRSAKISYHSEDTLLFSIQNVINEVLNDDDQIAISFNFSEKESFLFFPYSTTLKSDSYGVTTKCLEKIQRNVFSSLNITLSFIVDKPFDSYHSFKTSLHHLLDSSNQRFYMETCKIEKKRLEAKTNESLFEWYDKASNEIRQLIINKDVSEIRPLICKWMDIFKEKEYSAEIVKDWTLKLLLDLKVKMKALQFFGTNTSNEVLHEEVIGIDSLIELRTWLIHYFEMLLSAVNSTSSKSRRKEVLEACKYVEVNLEKKITLDEVANILYLNPSYFSRLFKKEVGGTFVEYVTRAKMNRAKELLEQTVDSVGKICERLGYDNQSYFIKVFKNYVGVTPIEYRGEKR